MSRQHSAHLPPLPEDKTRQLMSLLSYRPIETVKKENLIADE
jgi:hypothetical protein